MTQELLARITDLSTEGSTTEVQSLAQAILALQPAAPASTSAPVPTPTPAN